MFPSSKLHCMWFAFNFNLPQNANTSNCFGMCSSAESRVHCLPSQKIQFRIENFSNKLVCFWNGLLIQIACNCIWKEGKPHSVHITHRWQMNSKLFAQHFHTHTKVKYTNRWYSFEIENIVANDNRDTNCDALCQ